MTWPLALERLSESVQDYLAALARSPEQQRNLGCLPRVDSFHLRWPRGRSGFAAGVGSSTLDILFGAEGNAYGETLQRC